mmetsp:Transcript_32932/g.81862  ORF Transcript_32932/g.81862 Transcript_32932/m.81862 type:complete len:107 (+) Transcript_32932:1604-1924(+)
MMADMLDVLSTNRGERAGSSRPRAGGELAQAVVEEDDAVEEISGLITACLSLGNVLGPLGGTVLASSLGFRMASDVLGVIFCANALWLLRLRYRPTSPRTVHSHET